MLREIRSDRRGNGNDDPRPRPARDADRLEDAEGGRSGAAERIRMEDQPCFLQVEQPVKASKDWFWPGFLEMLSGILGLSSFQQDARGLLRILSMRDRGMQMGVPTTSLDLWEE